MNAFAKVVSIRITLIALLAVCSLNDWAIGEDRQSKSSTDGVALTSPAIPAGVTGVVRTLNQKLSTNLAPSDNAVVDLVQLFGDAAFEPKLREDSLAMLGIARLSNQGPRFVHPEAFFQGARSSSSPSVRRDLQKFPSQVCECGEKVWSSNEYPLVHEFLAANHEPLDVVVHAALLPRYYAPMLTDAQPPRLLSASLVIERRLPFIAHALAARALLRFGERDLVSAINDVSACRRLAVLLATGSPFDVSVAKAQIIDAIGQRALTAIIESGRLTGEEAKLMLAEFQRLPQMPSPGLAADVGERAILHQEVGLILAEGHSIREFFELTEEDGIKDAQGVLMSDLSLSSALRRADEIQDSFVRALSIHERGQQYKEFQALDQSYQEWQKTSEEKTVAVLKSIETNPDVASRWIGETIAYSLRPWYWQRRLSDDRVRLRQNFVTIGLALIACRADHGEFPSRLTELAPVYLNDVPLDAHSDAPVIYERHDDGRVRLVSWGANLTNDAGLQFNDDQMLELRSSTSGKALKTQ